MPAGRAAFRATLPTLDDGDPIPAPFLTIPTLLLLWGWLFHWEQEDDIIQPRVTVDLVAGLAGIALCVSLYSVASPAGFGEAHG